MKNEIDIAVTAAKSLIAALEQIGLGEYVHKPLLNTANIEQHENLATLDEEVVRPSFIREFKVGQTVFYFSHNARVWDGIIKKISKGEILVQGNTLGWYTADLLFHTLGEAYSALDRAS